MSEVGAEMPRYQCHKRVHALKIKEVTHEAVRDAAGPIGKRRYLVPEEEGFAPIPVSDDWYEKQMAASRTRDNPLGGLEGGYYVVYEDGYASFSPAEAFESGYTLITHPPADAKAD